MIYTGYYGRDGKKPNCVGISNYVPHYLPHVPHIPCLAPTMRMVYDANKNIITNEEYEIQYIALLESRNIPWEQLGYELQGKILCCFEKDDFCHRHIVARLFREKGFDVEELSDMLPTNNHQGIFFE